MYRITGYRRSYDWGSPTAMFEFLGDCPDGDPFAELWFGAHPTGSATVLHGDQRGTMLGELISAQPVEALGPRVHEQFGQLPFLVKLLAPGRPLSMQVHPAPQQAQQGYAREEALEVPLDAPERTYKDTHHKPEMVYALTRFEGLVGFREPAHARRILRRVSHPRIGEACRVLSDSPDGEGLRTALTTLLQLTARDVDTVVGQSLHLSTDESVTASDREVFETVVELAAVYPGDVGAVISVLLNRVALEPGESVFLGDGVPHAYLNGFGLELMANSDNVLRLGLTTKHVNPPAMLDCLDFEAQGARIEHPISQGSQHIFVPAAEEFALRVVEADPDARRTIPLGTDGPSIVICLEGSVRVCSEACREGVSLARGQAVFVTACDGRAWCTGAGAAAQAYVP